MLRPGATLALLAPSSELQLGHSEMVPVQHRCVFIIRPTSLDFYTEPPADHGRLFHSSGLPADLKNVRCLRL